MADEDNIPLTSNKDVKITVSKAKKNAIETEIVPLENLRAPIKKGDVVATLKIIIPKSEIQSIDLIAAKDIAEAGYISSFFSSSYLSSFSSLSHKLHLPLLQYYPAYLRVLLSILLSFL